MNAKPAIITLLAAALALLVLSGCGPRDRIVSVPCVNAKDLPADPPSARDRLTGNAATDVLVLADIALAWKAVAVKRAALLAGCVG